MRLQPSGDQPRLLRGACRQRVYRTKLASAAGLPAGASLSLETLRTSKRTGLPSRDARALSPERRARRESKPTRPRRPDDRITIPTNEIEAYLAGNRDVLEERLPPSARPSPRKSTVAVSVERTTSHIGPPGSPSSSASRRGQPFALSALSLLHDLERLAERS